MKKEFLSGGWVRLDIGDGISCMVWVVSKKSETDKTKQKRAMSILKKRLSQKKTKRKVKCVFDGKPASFHICRECADELL